MTTVLLVILTLLMKSTPHNQSPIPNLIKLLHPSLEPIPSINSPFSIAPPLLSIAVLAPIRPLVVRDLIQRAIWSVKPPTVAPLLPPAKPKPITGIPTAIAETAMAALLPPTTMKTLQFNRNQTAKGDRAATLPRKSTTLAKKIG
jgi:hypothetical protein